MKAHLTRQTFLASLAFAGLALAAAPALAQSAAKIGAPAPAFEAVDSNGQTRKLSEFAGKTVILEWTNHDCPYVRKHYNSATMQTLQKDMAKEGVVWLSVISSPVGEQGHVDGARANELTKSRDAAPAAVLLDPNSKVARAYGATTTPHMYIIDAKARSPIWARSTTSPPPARPASKAPRAMSARRWPSSRPASRSRRRAPRPMAAQ